MLSNDPLHEKRKDAIWPHVGECLRKEQKISSV